MGEQARLAGVGILLQVDEAVEQRVQRSDPRKVGTFDGADLTCARARLGGRCEQGEDSQRGGPRGGGLPPEQVAAGRRLGVCPASEREVIVLEFIYYDDLVREQKARRTVSTIASR